MLTTLEGEVLERAIQRYLKTRVKTLGGSWRKVKWLGRRGAPDNLILFPGKNFFVETKRPGKDWQSHQRREANKLKASGFRVYKADTEACVDVILKVEGLCQTSITTR